MADEQTVDTLGVISDAAKLMLRCVGLEYDRQLEKAGWRTYYAVDVDVVAFYLSPERMQTYAGVFTRIDRSDDRSLLARLLGEFIFGEYQSSAAAVGAPQGVLFVIPPHDEELARMILGMSEGALKHHDQASEKYPAVVKAELARREGKVDSLEFAQWLMDHASDVIEAFDSKSGPVAELTRFDALHDRRLMNLDRYTEPETGWKFPLLQLRENRNQFEGYTKCFDAWRSRLLTHKTQDQTVGAVITDALVLATLESLNGLLEQQKRRIVLVTGTRGIISAASAQIFSDSQYPRNFADAFVRHPQAFIAHRQFFSTFQNADGNDPVKKSTDAFKLIEWLNLLFPRVLRDDPGVGPHINTAMLDAVEKSARTEFDDAVKLWSLASAGTPSFSSALVNTWHTAVRKASIAKRLVEGSAWPERAFAFANWLKLEASQTIEPAELLRALSTRGRKPMESLYTSTAYFGLWSRMGISRERARGIPALRFDAEYKEAQAYYNKVLEAMRSLQEGASFESLLDVPDMYKGLASVDPSNYHAHLIHALAYAIKGHWFATRTLCRVAIGIVDALPDDQKRRRRGREAAYLMAIAERRMARSVTDLDLAADILTDAQRRENPETKHMDARFESERLALDVARMNFQVFAKNSFRQAAEALDNVMSRGRALLERIKSDELPEARQWVRQQVLVNVFDVVLLAFEADAEYARARGAEVRWFIRILEEHRRDQDDGVSTWDDLAEFVCNAAVAVFDDNPSSRAAAQASVQSAEFPIFLKFDFARGRLFKTLALGAR